MIMFLEKVVFRKSWALLSAEGEVRLPLDVRREGGSFSISSVGEVRIFSGMTQWQMFCKWGRNSGVVQ